MSELSKQIILLATDNGIPDDVANQLANMLEPLIMAVRKEERAFCMDEAIEAVKPVLGGIDAVLGETDDVIKAIEELK